MKYSNSYVFNTTLEEYKDICPNGTSDYIPKIDFDTLQVILLYVNFQKKYKSSLFLFFIFELPGHQMFLIRSYLFAIFSIVVHIKFALIKNIYMTPRSHLIFDFLVVFQRNSWMDPNIILLLYVDSFMHTYVKIFS